MNRNRLIQIVKSCSCPALCGLLLGLLLTSAASAGRGATAT